MIEMGASLDTIYSTIYNLGETSAMSKWDKLLIKLNNLSPDLRFEELRKILETYGYTMKEPGTGSSHCTFRKAGKMPITIPRHKPIKKIYIELVRDLIEQEESHERS